jgi:nitrite reductase/ring-hydroxylating ferredoxin subunit
VGKIKIARANEIAEGGTVKFPLTVAGRRSEGFVSRYQGKLVAYENKCQHLPLHLDFDSGKFYTQDGEHFICQTHNATYEPLTGLCVRGPCEGASLKKLKIEEKDGDVWLIN